MKTNISLVSLVSLASLLFSACQPQVATSPEIVAQSYARAVWARDFGAAYQLLSAADRAAQSEASYVAQNDPFDGGTLELARHVAGLIEFSDVNVANAGEQATVTMHVRVPDGNDADVSEILRAEREGGELSSAQIRDLEARLDELWAAGQVEVIEGDYTLALNRHDGDWGVYLKLDEAVRVELSGSVQAGLPWEFEPLSQEVLLFPGQSATLTYRARNMADHAITGKAVQTTLPGDFANALYFAQCFCLLQETLEPGQEEMMVAVIRLDRPLPDGVELQVHYDFYPIEAFP